MMIKRDIFDIDAGPGFRLLLVERKLVLAGLQDK